MKLTSKVYLIRVAVRHNTANGVMFISHHDYTFEANDDSAASIIASEITRETGGSSWDYR